MSVKTTSNDQTNEWSGFYFIAASIYVVGSLSGSLCGGWQCGKFGRKKSLVIDCLLFIIGTVSSALAPNFYVLLFSRWLLGHASTSQQVTVPIYVSEISQPQMRTITGPFAIICYACGFAGGYIFGKSISSHRVSAVA